jgi:hypothetical protein
LDELLTYGRPMSREIVEKAAPGETIIRPPTTIEEIKKEEA